MGTTRNDRASTPGGRPRRQLRGLRIDPRRRRRPTPWASPHIGGDWRGPARLPAHGAARQRQWHGRVARPVDRLTVPWIESVIERRTDLILSTEFRHEQPCQRWPSSPPPSSAGRSARRVRRTSCRQQGAGAGATHACPRRSARGPRAEGRRQHVGDNIRAKWRLTPASRHCCSPASPQRGSGSRAIRCGRRFRGRTRVDDLTGMTAVGVQARPSSWTTWPHGLRRRSCQELAGSGDYFPRALSSRRRAWCVWPRPLPRSGPNACTDSFRQVIHR